MAGANPEPSLETLTDDLKAAFANEIKRSALEPGRSLVHTTEENFDVKQRHADASFRWTAETWAQTQKSIVATALEHIDGCPAATWTWRLKREKGAWPLLLQVETPEV